MFSLEKGFLHKIGVRGCIHKVQMLVEKSLLAVFKIYFRYFVLIVCSTSMSIMAFMWSIVIDAIKEFKTNMDCRHCTKKKKNLKTI